MFSSMQYQTLKLKENDETHIRETFGHLLSTAENLTSKLNTNPIRKNKFYDSYNSFKSKSINSFLHQFIFQIEMFEAAYKSYCKKYGTFDFPSNLSKEAIINHLQKLMELVEEKYKIYYLAIINILYNKPIPKLDIVIGKDPQDDYDFLENNP